MTGWTLVVALAVDLGDEPEHPVGRGMLGPDVEGHVWGLQLDGDRGLDEMADQVLIEHQSGLRVLFGGLVGSRRHCRASPRRRPSPARASPRGSGAGSTSQRIALEAVGEIELDQIGMALEVDAEHLVGFPLVPVGPGKHPDQAGDRRRLLGEVGREDDPATLTDITEQRRCTSKRSSTGSPGGVADLRPRWPSRPPTATRRRPGRSRPGPW